MIDTHCHLTEPRLFDQLPAVFVRAAAAGVSKIITIGTDLPDDEAAIRVCRSHSNVRCAIGVHPGHCDRAQLADLDRLGELIHSPGVIAVGEMGLDYHYEPVDRPRQIHFFQTQLQLAAGANLAVVIHSREAVDDTLAVMKNFPTVRGVFHCFTGTADEATRILDAGYFLGFTGVVTFKKTDEVREACRRTPDDRILVETDAPWLSPEPMRNQKVNEPAFVMHTARRVAEIRGTSIEAIDEMTTGNAKALFGWG